LFYSLRLQTRNSQQGFSIIPLFLVSWLPYPIIPFFHNSLNLALTTQHLSLYVLPPNFLLHHSEFFTLCAMPYALCHLLSIMVELRRIEPLNLFVVSVVVIGFIVFNPTNASNSNNLSREMRSLFHWDSSNSIYRAPNYTTAPEI